MNNEMPAKLQEVFRENLRRRLQELEMNQRDLAKALDVSDATVSILLNGGHAANLDTVERVAKVLRTSSLYLLTPANLEIIPETEPIRG